MKKVMQIGGWTLFMLSLFLLAFWVFSWSEISRIHQRDVVPRMEYVENNHPLLHTALEMNNLNLNEPPFGSDAILAAEVLRMRFFQQIYFSMLLFFAANAMLCSTMKNWEGRPLQNMLRGVFLLVMLVMLVLTVRCRIQYSDIMDLVPADSGNEQPLGLPVFPPAR